MGGRIGYTGIGAGGTMRIRTSELLMTSALLKLGGLALRVAVLLLGVAVWTAMTCARGVLWPVLRWFGRDMVHAARRVWGASVPAPRGRNRDWPDVRWARRGVSGLPTVSPRD